MNVKDQSLCLYFSDEKGGSKIYPLDKEKLVIGRDHNCDIVLFDQSISRRHAVVRVDEKGATTISDGVTGELSANGVFVGDKKVKIESRLHVGDVVRMGVFRFEVRRTASLKEPIGIDEIDSLFDFEAYLQRGDTALMKDSAVLAIMDKLGIDTQERERVFDICLDYAMRENQLQRVAILSRLKGLALKDNTGLDEDINATQEFFNYEGIPLRKGSDSNRLMLVAFVLAVTVLLFVLGWSLFL